MAEDRVMLGIILTMFFIGLFIYFSTIPSWLGESTIKFIKIILATAIMVSLASIFI